jgi:phosphopantetheine adenylyltransferase
LIGSLLGSLFAGLVAFGTIKVMDKNKKRQEEKAHCGHLDAIRSQLNIFESLFQTLFKEIDGLKESFSVTKRVAYDSAFYKVQDELLKELLLKAVEYGNYNINIVEKLITYLGYLNILRREVNFVPLKNLREIFDEKGEVESSEYLNRVDGYFMQVQGHISVLSDLGKEIFKEITMEIMKSKTVNIIVDKTK